MVFEVIRGHQTPKLGVFGVIWGQNPNIFKARQIIYQNAALDPVIKIEWFSRSSEFIWPRNWGYLGSFGVKIQSFSNRDKLLTKMNLLVPWLQLSGFRGQLRSSYPKLGVFGVIWGQNLNIFKPGQTIYQNEALCPVININWFSRSSEVIKLGAVGVIWGQNSKKFKLRLRTSVIEGHLGLK